MNWYRLVSAEAQSIFAGKKDIRSFSPHTHSKGCWGPILNWVSMGLQEGEIEYDKEFKEIRM